MRSSPKETHCNKAFLTDGSSLFFRNHGGRLSSLTDPAFRINGYGFIWIGMYISIIMFVAGFIFPNHGYGPRQERNGGYRKDDSNRHPLNTGRFSVTLQGWNRH